MSQGNENMETVRLDEDLVPGQIVVIDGEQYRVHGETPTALELVAVSSTSEIEPANSAVAVAGPSQDNQEVIALPNRG